MNINYSNKKIFSHLINENSQKTARSKTVYNLSSKTFAKLFSTRESVFNNLTRYTINNSNFKYRIVEGRELENAILEIIKTLDSENISITGPHRQDDWEKGWLENLSEFKHSNYNINTLIPKFVKKGQYIRFNGNLISPESEFFETHFVSVLRYYLFSRYLKNIDNLYEFGTGTGLNLVSAYEVFPHLRLIGLDWANATEDILRELNKKLSINIFSKRFNLFKPDNKYVLKKNSAILTIGTLEQLGENFRPFIKYLLKNKPKICIHMETLYDTYDKNNLLDYLAIKYLEKRNYLRGFLPYLISLEKKNKIKIIEIRRTFGSLYHEGYTYLVWKTL